MFGTKCGWPDLIFLALTEDGRLLMQHRKKPAMVSGCHNLQLSRTLYGVIRKRNKTQPFLYNDP